MKITYTLTVVETREGSLSDYARTFEGWSLNEKFEWLSNVGVNYFFCYDSDIKFNCTQFEVKKEE